MSKGFVLKDKILALEGNLASALLESTWKKDHLDKDGIVDVIVKVLQTRDNFEPELEAILECWTKPRRVKDDPRSQREREDGNNQVKIGHFQDALARYNDSVLYASAQSQDQTFALALANRSLALLKVGSPREALRDIDLAIAQGYPPENKYKLLQRILKCFVKVEDLEQARKALTNLQKEFKTPPNVPKRVVQAILQEAQRDLRQLERSKKVSSFLDLDPRSTPEASDPLQVSNPNPEIPAATSALKVQHSPERGRHSIANRDIDVGELIIRDQPLVHVIHPLRAKVNCYTCAQHVLAPIPCSTCSNTVFCSISCRDAALTSRYDCSLSIPDLFTAQTPTGSGYTALIAMALKAVSQRPASFFTTWAVEVFHRHQPDSKPGSKRPECAHYDVFFNMVFHLNSDNILEHLSIALMLWKHLKNQGYFLECEASTQLPDGRSNVDAFFIYLLLHFYSVIVCNNHTIQEISRIDMTAEKVMVGSAVYPHVASLLNHSCDPNTSPIQVGLDQLTFATRLIAFGEEVTHIYQAHFGNTEKADRRRILQRMFSFECSCQACQLDYPLAKDLRQTYDNPTLDQHHEKLNLTLQGLTEQPKNSFKMLEIYLDRARFIAKHLEPPHMYYLSSRAAITDCLWVLHGNKAPGLGPRMLQGVYL